MKVMEIDLRDIKNKEQGLKISKKKLKELQPGSYKIINGKIVPDLDDPVMRERAKRV